MDTQSANPLTSIKPVSTWMAEDAATVFPTPRTWEFFRTAHKEELVKAGVLFLGSGRRSDYVDANGIGGVVRDILTRESMARLHQDAGLPTE